jgi:hypothetical protein
MAHLLRYGTAVNTSILRQNPQHNFAHLHAMQIYDSNAIYSMIPKNGCTTLRLSIAIANGVIAEPGQWEWIHANNDSFKPSLKDLALAAYRFTVLRDPFGRLVSCFLDKIVSRTADAEKFLEAAKSGTSLDDLTFRQFCHGLTRPGLLTSNIHWRPQVHFLVYADYDDYFCFEDFGRVGPLLKAVIGLDVIDARPLARHDTSRYRPAPASFSSADLTVPQIAALLKAGAAPRPDSFFDEELIGLVRETYAKDFALYRAQFPRFGLFRDYDGRAAMPAAV